MNLLDYRVKELLNYNNYSMKIAERELPKSKKQEILLTKLDEVRIIEEAIQQDLAKNT